MTRKALIIANPGERGAEGYCSGVEKDIDNYNNYLRSPEGGFWQDNEIDVLWQPRKREVRAEILAQGLVDYSMTIFCGHGHYSAVTNSTIIQMRPGVGFDSDELRSGAQKHTLILDCCREVAPEAIIRLDEMAKAAKAKSVINPTHCRDFYDKAIAACGTGLVVLFGCSVNERAGDSASQGGYYSYNLITSAEIWNRETYVDTTGKYRSLSVVAAHERAIPRVRTVSGGRQTPSIEKPRSDRHFPFCIIA